MSKLEDQYNQNIQAYKDMGLGIPCDFETVKSKLTKWQKEVISKGTGQLVITPAITDEFTLYDLIEAFDKKQDISTDIYKELWDQYDFSQPVTIAVVNNKLQETNKTWEKQAATKTTFLNPVEWVILNAVNRPNYLDTSTVCRFPQYKMKTVLGDSSGPDAGGNGRGAGLAGSIGFAHPDYGFRSVVGERVELGSHTSVLTSSSEAFKEKTDNAIVFLKEQGFKIWKEY